MKSNLIKSKYNYPPRQRRLMIHSWFIILFGVIAAMLFLMSCSAPKTGCESLYHKKKKFTAWLKCKQTHKVFVLDKEGAIVCVYFDPN